MTRAELIFLAGFPRSGTTWFSNLINANPTVAYRHEFLGRLWDELPEDLFTRMKIPGGLSAEQQATVIRSILEAQIEADRPPFFPKVNLRLGNDRLHHVCWLLAKSLPAVLATPYRLLFTPVIGRECVLLVKETRSAVDMDAILENLKPALCVFLFRNPCGALASRIRGIRQGRMAPPTADQLKEIVARNEKNMAELNVDTELGAWETRTVEAKLALMWNLQNLAYLKLSKDHRSLVVDYDDFYARRHEQTKSLLVELGLGSQENSLQFIRSAESPGMSIKKMDAGSEYYSVFRGENFDPNTWESELSRDQIAEISEITASVYAQMQQAAWGQ
ncbi:MAG: sulfotransferase [Pseudomonadota bacterium]